VSFKRRDHIIESLANIMARPISEIIWEWNKNWEEVACCYLPFTLLEEGRKVCSYEGNHILAIFKEPEKYK